MKRSQRRWLALRLALCLAAAALAGCTTLIKTEAEGRWIPIAPGSTLTLAEPVRIPPGRARVFFVNGQPSTSAANYRPVCALEVRHIDERQAQTIAPARYRIARIQNYWTEVVAVDKPNAVLFALADHDGDGGYSMIRTGFHFWLDGDQADPMRLTCLGVMADPAEAYPPTLEEIRQALGAFAAIEVAAQPR
ncbi:MAG: hypothetical protein K9L70_10895 [Thiohalocapsa sp.]|nr:hypothetical protein [Thiohalocapsa sp.]MCF7989647.1 hypothetical protein [Thiohalocapsa sp.]